MDGWIVDALLERMGWRDALGVVWMIILVGRAGADDLLVWMRAGV